jgi:integrase/recombinase XerD
MIPSSTTRHHKVIKKYVNRAVDSGIIKENPYKRFKIPADRSRLTHLTASELNQIRKYKGIERLERVKDLFIFQCITGMAYIDMQNLKLSDIKTEGKTKHIEKYRQKVDRMPQVIILLPEAEKIIQKHKGSIKCFPEISNQKMNAYLKEIATICNIDKPLTTHVARHTFATLMLEKGMPLESISNMLGHASVRQTAVYAKLKKNKIINDLKRLKINKL